MLLRDYDKDHGDYSRKKRPAEIVEPKSVKSHGGKCVNKGYRCDYCKTDRNHRGEKRLFDSGKESLYRKTEPPEKESKTEIGDRVDCECHKLGAFFRINEK